MNPGISAAPLPEGIATSRDYAVRADGLDLDVLEVPVPEERIAEEQRFPYAFASFTAPEGRETTVEIEILSDSLALRRPRVWPERLGVPVAVRGAKRASFLLRAPCTAVLEADGRHRALVLAVRTPEAADAPREGDPDVIYVGPGLHRRDLTVVGPGQTLYLAGGAVLEGAVRVEGDNAVICGRGIVSGIPWPWQQGPLCPDGGRRMGHMVSLRGRNLAVRDVTLLSAWCWTLVLDGTENVAIENVAILGGRVINDDGIDVCRARGTVVRDCFVRCQDDCIAPKWWCEDLLVERCALWTDVANIFRIGYECDPPPALVRNLVFRDIDILHTTLEPSETTSYWANTAITIQPSNNQRFEAILFEDLRFHELDPWDIFLVVKTMPLTVFFRVPDAGTAAGITLRDIHLPPCVPAPPVRLESHDPSHPIRGVRFENVTGYGAVEILGAVRDVSL